MASSIAPSPLAQIEIDRLARIAENRKRLEACGVLESAKALADTLRAATAVSKPAIKKAPKERRRKTRYQPVRRSGRLNGDKAEFGPIDEDCCGNVTYDDYEYGLKDLLAGDAEIEALPEEKQTQFQEMRCAAAGRGSMYDSVAGITCHFCRQKKLCGEEGYPRCSRRSTTAECIGKSDCARCHSATGRFCRACLLIRYGQKLEDVREQMAAGTWLCPHCYEEEHPEEGWMCNSSICMTRRGFRPTGIAIYDAQQRGFPSVAHWLQAQLLKNNAAAAAAPAAAAAAAAAKEVSSSGSNASSQGEAEVTAAAVKPASLARSKKDKGAAAAAAADASAYEDTGFVSSQESKQAVAPTTPSKCCDGTPGPAAAAAARRATRGAVAAAAELFKAAAAVVPASKRVCVDEAAGTRRTLRSRQ